MHKVAIAVPRFWVSVSSGTIMTILLASIGETLRNEFALAPGEADILVSSIVRLFVAMVLGGILGLAREWAGKIAGLRTHMLTALGAALFLLAPRVTGISEDAASRIVQGVVVGIGFLGGGVILKQDEAGRIKGVTTAAGVWLTAAVGICAGLGRLWLAILSTLIAVLILHGLHRLERWIRREAHADQTQRVNNPADPPHSR